MILVVRPVRGMPLLVERQADKDRDRRSKQILQRADRQIERIDQELERIEQRFGRVDGLYRDRLHDRTELSR